MELLPVPLCCKAIKLLAQLFYAYVRKGTAWLPLLLLSKLIVLLLMLGCVVGRVRLAAGPSRPAHADK